MQWRSAPTRWLWAWRSAAVGEELIDAFVARIESVTAQMRAEGTDIHLVLTVAVPADEVLYGVFDGCEPGLVSRTCAQAGLEPQRLSGKVGTRILHSDGQRRGNPDS